MATTPRAWGVVTHDGTGHTFEAEDKAVAFAMLMAWADRPTTVVTPEGAEYVVLRRTAAVTIQVVRAL